MAWFRLLCLVPEKTPRATGAAEASVLAGLLSGITLRDHKSFIVSYVV